MSRESALLKNTAILSIGTFLPKLASFVILPILTGCLTKEEYGTYDLVLVLVSLFLPAVTLQIQTAAFRFLIDCRDDYHKCAEIISTIFVSAVSISVVATVIFFLVWQDCDLGIKAVICVYFLLDIVSNISRQSVRGLGKNMQFSASAIISAIFQLILAVLLVLFFGLGFFGSLVALAVAEFASAGYLVLGTGLLCYIKPTLFSLSTLKNLLGYSWPMVPNSMSMWAMRMSNRVVITLFLGLPANAIFAAAYKVPQIISLAQTTFTMAWQENASLSANDDDREKYYSKIHNKVFDFLSGFSALLIGLSPVAYMILIRGDYTDALYQMPILIVGMLFYGMSAYLGGIYVAYLKTKSVGVTTVIAAVLNLAIDIFFIPYFGLYAASCALLISYLFLWAYRMIDVQKIQRIQFNYGRYILATILLGIMVLIGQFQSIECQILNGVLGFVLFIIFSGETLKDILKLLKHAKKGNG